MSMEGLAVAFIVLTVAAARAAAHLIRDREADLTDEGVPVEDAQDEFLHGMRYRAWDDDRREIVFVGGRCRHVTGYEAEELLSGVVRALSDLIHPEDRELVASEVRKAVDSDSTYKLNYRIRAKNGTWRWVSDRGGRIPSNAETFAGVEGVLIDISDRVSAELARVRLEKKHGFLLENIADLIGVHDADGRFQFATPSSETLIGYGPTELQNKSIYPIIHPEDRQRVRSRIEKRVREDCEPIVVRHRIRSKQGRYVPVETQCKPVQDSEGFYTRFVTVTRDVSEHARLKQSLQELNRQAADQEHMREQFLEGMNRELRTSLTSILGFAEVLAGEVAEGQREALEMIRESGEHILSTLTSVMDVEAARTASSDGTEVGSGQRGDSIATEELPGTGQEQPEEGEISSLFEKISVPEDESTQKRYGRILALDDNRPMRLILERHLNRFFEVDLVSDADEAVGRARRHPYEVVLLDINLGTKKNGMDVLKEMKELPGYGNAFFIAVTAYALPEEKTRFLRAGFDGLVSKPFTRDSLLKEISRVTMLNLELNLQPCED